MDNRQEVGMLVAQRQEQPEDRSLRASWLEQQEDHILDAERCSTALGPDHWLPARGIYAFGCQYLKGHES